VPHQCVDILCVWAVYWTERFIISPAPDSSSVEWSDSASFSRPEDIHESLLQNHLVRTSLALLVIVLRESPGVLESPGSNRLSDIFVFLSLQLLAHGRITLMVSLCLRYALVLNPLNFCPCLGEGIGYISAHHARSTHPPS
jgi:hypothetical protein